MDLSDSRATYTTSENVVIHLCLVANTGEADRTVERNVTSLLRHRRRKRSVSVERNVETLVVVDRAMTEYYKNEDIENYVLTIINMVIGLPAANTYHICAVPQISLTN